MDFKVVRRACRLWGMWLGLMLYAACSAARGQDQSASSQDRDRVRDLELRYAQGLMRLGLPEYAEAVLARIGEGGPKSKVLKIEIYLARGQFDEVKAIIAREPDQNSPETWAMRLALADAYYAWGRYADAKAIYESFFAKYTGTPPPSIVEFYVNSAHRYGQMLVLIGEVKEAAAAYENAIRVCPDKNVRRQLLAENGELLLKIAQSAPPGERDAYLTRVDKICDELLWIQDIWFGKAIVMKAHIKLMRNDIDGAMKMIEEYKEQLAAIHQSLKEQAQETGNEELTRLSPMAECRYLLGVILQNEAERLLNSGGGKARIVELLAGKEERGKTTQGALQHFYNVFIRYPNTSWAPEAGSRAKQVEKLLEKLGKKVEINVPAETWQEVEKAQFQTAKALFNQNRWEEAATTYLKTLNVFPETDLAIIALGDTCICYIELGEELYAEMILRYLGERFGRRERFAAKAGDQVLLIAQAYAERGQKEKAEAVRQYFAEAFPTDSRAPTILFRAAEQKFAAKDFSGAMEIYQRIVQNYSKAPIYAEALSRMASCFRETGNYQEEVKTLAEYVKVLESRDYPGPGLIAGKYRLAMAYRELGEQYLPAAINRLVELTKLLSGDLSKYQKTVDDAKANSAIFEAALFQLGAGLARLPAPTNQPPAVYKAQAIKVYDDLLTRFPKSQYAPAALSQQGTLWTILQRPDEAKRVFERLQKEYADSPEAKNANFMLGKSLLDLGRRQEAVAVFKEMFGSAGGKYTEAQILTAGNELRKAGEFEMAVEAYERVSAAAKDRALREPALAGKGLALIKLGKLEEGIKTLEALLAEYKNSGFTVEACFALAEAYSLLGEKEPDEIKRINLFNGAMRAMKTARRYVSGNPAEQARSDLEVARIYERQAKASERFNAPAAAQEQRGSAIATYQILIMRADPAARDVLPYVEEAFRECIPLLLQTERWQDAYDNCEHYLKLFTTRGRYAPDVSGWLNKAKGKLAAQGASAGAAAAAAQQ